MAMTQEQAAKEVIKYKKEYEAGSKADANFYKSDQAKNISAMSQSIRQSSGLDESRYGSGVGLADAYTNYHTEFGQGSQQQTQSTPMEGSGQTSALQDLGGFYQQSSNDFLSAQTANFDKMLSQQIASLESSYAQAISEGKISVRDAEKAFLEQKSSIEKQAYQQAEATKGYGSEMGIANSQQMMGLQQGDNARVRSANSGNMSDRDSRIADIKDRISTLSTQKNLAINSAQADHGYNIAGAQAQASQMYNQNMGGLMQEDYFTNKTQANTEKNMSIQQGYTKDNMATEQGYNVENRAADFQNTLKAYQEQAKLDIQKMYVGKEIDLDLMEQSLINQFKTMDKQFGISSSLNSQQHSNSMRQISAQASAAAAKVNNEYKAAMDAEIRRLGLPANSNEYDIDQALIKRGEDAAAKEYKFKRDSAMDDIVFTATTNYAMGNLFNNPALEYDGKAPVDYTKAYTGVMSPLNLFGDFNNALFGTKEGTKTHNSKEAEKAKAQKAIDDFIKNNSN